VLAGANVAKVSDAPYVGSRTGFVGGLSAEIDLDNHLGIEIDALYSQQGFEYHTDGLDQMLRLDYLQLPVLLHVRFPTHTVVRPFIVVGPQVGFRVTCEATSGSESSSCQSSFGMNAKSVDVGGTVGAGVGFRLGGEELSVQARYSVGLNRLFDQTETSNLQWKNRVFSVMAGLSF
jgi:hypothetical protein